MKHKWKFGIGALFILLVAAAIVTAFQCSQNEPPAQTATRIQQMETDKAAYTPGETVSFFVQLTDPNKKSVLTVDYYHLNKVIFTEKMEADNETVHWTWKPPNEDFKGYLVRVQAETGGQQDEQTIAVDVSSDWSKFPRYGFLSRFHDLPAEEMESIISRLNRYHLNGLQFYDWQYKHHQPLKMDNAAPAAHWEDIANRPTSLQTIHTYIQLAHERNMKAMAYNLLYGAFAEAEKDGVKTEWRLFKDQNQQIHDVHPLPDEWKSDVFLVNPSHPDWQYYVTQQQKNVYTHLPFDGWHIDQLGSRGEVYDEKGSMVPLEDSFAPFTRKIKEEIPDKRLVMNAVNQFGQNQLGRAPVDFLYTEVWDEFKEYGDLKHIIDENSLFSDGAKNTVLAAYMNYEASEQQGEFNPAGILLANSVIFASGGAHLELGEHMLSKEYFPHDQLEMSRNLDEKLIHYYDFLTAYENILRDGLQEAPVEVWSSDWAPFSHEPEKGKIWTFAKQQESRKAVHFINFFDADTMEWRDTNALQPEPKERRPFNVHLTETRTVKSIWLASPDKQQGTPSPLSFRQTESEITFTLPSLTYWNMVVIEYENE